MVSLFNFGKQREMLAIILAAALVALSTSTCKDDLKPVELMIQENTPKDTVLLKITDEDSLSVGTEPISILKAVNGSLLMAVNLFIDGPENADLCSQVLSDTVFVTTLECEGQEESLIFQVNFTDDHPTEFTIPPVSVKEAVSGIQVNYHPEPKDADCNTNFEFYAEETEETKPYFEIFEKYKIRIKQPLDYETQKQHIINVSAFNGGDDVSGVQAQLIINVEDVDDKDPYFDPEFFQRSINENGGNAERTVNGPPILARDGDTGINATLEYSIMSSTPYLNVSISDSGELLIAESLDREAIQAYTIIVKAQQADNPSASATATVSLTVTDVNDNRPSFTNQQRRNATIKEDASAGSHVVWLFAQDEDEAENANFEYEIHNDSGAFEVRENPITNLAELVTKDSDLLKDQDSVEVEIRLVETASAAGGEACDFETTCGTTVTVTLEDVNDHTPVFGKNRYIFKINDDQATNVPIGEIKATDEDKGANAIIKYSLLTLSGEGKPDCDKVQIDPTTGELTLKKRMLAGVECTLRVTACDSPLSTNTRLCESTIALVTVNESPSTDGSIEPTLYEARVKEGLEPGSFVMSLPMAGLNTDSEEFEIDDELLKTSVVLNREEKEEYIVSAGPRNGSEIIEIVRITVHVDDINDNSPVFTGEMNEITLDSEYQAGRIVLNVSATDADGTEVTYSLLNMRDIFTIEPTTGQISLAKSPSEAGTAYQGSALVLVVEAKDSGEPPLRTTANVEVHFPSTNETASVMVPVGKEKLTKDKSNVERKLSEILGVSVQVVGIQSISSVQDLGSRIFLKAAQQDSQAMSTEELSKLTAQYEKAIHNAFGEEYKDSEKDDGGSSPADNGSDDDDNVIFIVLLCLVVLLFILLVIFAVVFYRMRRSYQSELSLLTKLNKNTSIYDKAPLHPDPSTTTNGSVQASALNQNGSPRRGSVSLVAYYNQAFVADEESNDDPTYSHIHETSGIREPRSNIHPVVIANTSVPAARETELPARNSNESPASSRRLNGLSSGQLRDRGEEDPVYSVPRQSRNENANPVFRTTINVLYPQIDPMGNGPANVESTVSERPEAQNRYRNVPGSEDDNGGANWSFRRNSKLDVQQSPINSNNQRSDGVDFDDIDSKLVSPASSRHRYGSMKAGSESDSGLPSDRDLPLDDEAYHDARTAQPGSGTGNSPVYPNLHTSPDLGITRSTDPAFAQSDPRASNRALNSKLPPEEPEPDYEKKVRFDEAKRRSEMVELPVPDSRSYEEVITNHDSEITAL